MTPTAKPHKKRLLVIREERSACREHTRGASSSETPSAMVKTRRWQLRQVRCCTSEGRPFPTPLPTCRNQTSLKQYNRTIFRHMFFSALRSPQINRLNIVHLEKDRCPRKPTQRVRKCVWFGTARYVKRERASEA